MASLIIVVHSCCVRGGIVVVVLYISRRGDKRAKGEAERRARTLRPFLY